MKQFIIDVVSITGFILGIVTICIGLAGVGALGTIYFLG
jgi:hypothetical protein